MVATSKMMPKSAQQGCYRWYLPHITIYHQVSEFPSFRSILGLLYTKTRRDIYNGKLVGVSKFQTRPFLMNLLPWPAENQEFEGPELDDLIWKNDMLKCLKMTKNYSPFFLNFCRSIGARILTERRKTNLRDSSSGLVENIFEVPELARYFLA